MRLYLLRRGTLRKTVGMPYDPASTRRSTTVHDAHPRPSWRRQGEDDVNLQGDSAGALLSTVVAPAFFRLFVEPDVFADSATTATSDHRGRGWQQEQLRSRSGRSRETAGVSRRVGPPQEREVGGRCGRVGAEAEGREGGRGREREVAEKKIHAYWPCFENEKHDRQIARD